MSDKNEIIKLLKISPKVVGSKQVSRGIAEGTVGCVIVAEDADRALRKKLVAAAEIAGVAVEYAPSMEWLGRNSGRKARIQIALARVEQVHSKKILQEELCLPSIS